MIKYPTKITLSSLAFLLMGSAFMPTGWAADQYDANITGNNLMTTLIINNHTSNTWKLNSLLSSTSWSSITGDLNTLPPGINVFLIYRSGTGHITGDLRYEDSNARFQIGFDVNASSPSSFTGNLNAFAITSKGLAIPTDFTLSLGHRLMDSIPSSPTTNALNAVSNSINSTFYDSHEQISLSIPGQQMPMRDAANLVINLYGDDIKAIHTYRKISVTFKNVKENTNDALTLSTEIYDTLSQDVLNTLSGSNTGSQLAPYGYQYDSTHQQLTFSFTQQVN